MLDASLLELAREELGDYYDDAVEVLGGMDLLPRAFLPGLSGRIRYGARVVAIIQSGGGVSLRYSWPDCGPSSWGEARADYCILALPFTVLRFVEATFSAAKARAIRQLQYDRATKVFLQFRRRFWEEDEGIYGGSSLTDLPIRKIYYPNPGQDAGPGRGVLVASFTWGEDAQRWGALGERERLRQALADVSRIHAQAQAEIEAGVSKVWQQDPYAGGVQALFMPGQERSLYADSFRPEGRIHFAGEHTSLIHGWVEGAITSGLRAALEVQARE